jgi:hypothetical protein
MARWANCPGSYRLCQQAPAQPTSIYAATGTVAHDLVELALRSGGMWSAQARLGECVVRDGHEVTLDAGMISGVEMMFAYVVRTRADHFWMTVEVTVELEWIFANDRPPLEPLFGRADVVLLGDNAVEIVDYKNGRGVLVQAQDNMQLYYYAAGALKVSDPPVAPIEWVRLTIVQPNATTREKIRTIRIPTIDLLLWIDDVLIPAVRAVEDPDAPVVPGRWCQFCPAMGVCPAMHERALAVAELEFKPYTQGDQP